MTAKHHTPGPTWACPLCKRSYGSLFTKCAYCTPMEAYHILHEGRTIDTVFFRGYTEEDVRQCLMQHDGYPQGIVVRKDP